MSPASPPAETVNVLRDGVASAPLASTGPSSGFRGRGCGAASRESVIDLGSGLKILRRLDPLAQRIRGRFGNQPKWRAFVGWETYYRAFLGTDAARALIQHTGPLVGDAAQQIELTQAMAGGRVAAIVWAQPGCGKSRFALELARRLEKAPERSQVLFVQHDDTVVREELDEITRLKRLVLIVDDAHDCPDLVKLLAAACASASPTNALHLICCTRSTGRAEVSRALQSAFPPGVVQEMDLGRPAAGLVRGLIDKLLPKSSPHHRDTIARFVRQSYFGAVLVCTLLSRLKTLPQTFQRQDLRDRVRRDPFQEAVEGVCPIETALRALAVYAALSPVPRASVQMRELAAQLSALAPETIAILVDRLLAAGLFQEYGPGLVRPVPDLLGDLILEEACLDVQGKPTPYSKQLLERLFEAYPVETVRNCADIGQLFASVQDTDLVSGLVVARARSMPAEKKWEAMKLLQTLQPFAPRRPATVLEVAGILETRGILRRRPPAQELSGIDSIEMVTCVLLMRAGEVDLSVIPAALTLGRDLHSAARGDQRSSQNVLESIQSYCKFDVGRSLAHAKAAVDTLRAWVGEAEVEAAVLAAVLSAQFLTLEVEDQRVREHSVTPLSSALTPAPDVWTVRDLAVDTVCRAILRTEPTVRTAALDALYPYATVQGATDQGWADRWRPQLERELKNLLAAIKESSSTTNSLPVWAAAERLGWHWWTQESNELHGAGAAILASIPAKDAYQLWKLLHSQQLPVVTAPPADESVPAQARMEYFHGLSALREEDTAERARRSFDLLDPGYPDIDSWRAIWRAVFDPPPTVRLHDQAGAAIGEFARRHAEAAWSFVTEAEADGPLFPMLPFLLVELGKQDRARRSKLARAVRPGTRLEDACLRVLWYAQELDEAERELVARGLGSSDQETIHRAAAALLNSGGANADEAFNAVFATLARHPADGVLWELVIDRFVRWAESVLPPASMQSSGPMGRVAESLITLMQTYGSRLRWGFQPYTRPLPKLFAALAVVSPSRLQQWMQQVWGHATPAGTGWNDESPLNSTRLASAMGAIRESPVAAGWIDVFVEWLRGQRPLGSMAALGLAQICTLEHPRIVSLVSEIGARPTEDSLQSFVEFVRNQNAKADFAQRFLTLLEMWGRYPDSYAQMENAVIEALVPLSGSRARGQPGPVHTRILESIEARRAIGTSSTLLSASLVRIEREVRAAMATGPGEKSQAS